MVGDVVNIIYGDAKVLSNSAKGGDDIIYAGRSLYVDGVVNDIWGDGQLTGSAKGGKDLFVFKDDGSLTVGTQNTIEDFHHSQGDQIEFSDVAGVRSFADLLFTQSGANTIITAGADQVTLSDVTATTLVAGDFKFGC